VSADKSPYVWTGAWPSGPATLLELRRSPRLIGWLGPWHLSEGRWMRWYAWEERTSSVGALGRLWFGPVVNPIRDRDALR
jgi:hypothetical protein